MSKLTEIERVLSLCAEQLAVCAGEMARRKQLQEEKAVLKLGKAIAEVNEVRTAIYEMYPDLKPEHWDSPPTDEQYFEWFQEAKKIAEEYVEEGQLDQAISAIESFIFIGPTGPAESLAREELARLREKNGV
ncbi:MAG: hypothetical protein WDZ30_11050 [Cellvibrionaceae bacterium]